MKYLYLLQSIPHADQRYVALTSDVDKRLSAHNARKPRCIGNVDTMEEVW